ncbi:hypothetical protein SAY87_018529 [Trapa incisa]|uniref:Uncharacterized protein n=1 Tax=Trapa incisa TaxID=236973 RepID=A0AAN7LCH2_9MYRT|nr:hypothetical protein SAY87_018529 [Trapa incisa]
MDTSFLLYQYTPILSVEIVKYKALIKYQLLLKLISPCSGYMSESDFILAFASSSSALIFRDCFDRLKKKLDICFVLSPGLVLLACLVLSTSSFLWQYLGVDRLYIYIFL